MDTRHKAFIYTLKESIIIYPQDEVGYIIIFWIHEPVCIVFPFSDYPENSSSFSFPILSLFV